MTAMTLPRLDRPVPLAADNFTPPSRTPWGGERIGRHFKAALVPGAVGRQIGVQIENRCNPLGDVIEA